MTNGLEKMLERSSQASPNLNIGGRRTGKRPGCVLKKYIMYDFRIIEDKRIGNTHRFVILLADCCKYIKRFTRSRRSKPSLSDCLRKACWIGS